MASSSPPPDQQGGGGGFLLSPPASIASSSRPGGDSEPHNILPTPRRSPLRAGGSKESTFIRYVDQRLLHIQRRFAKRTTPAAAHLSEIDRDKADAWGDVRGYADMRAACRDLDDLLDMVWISGTPGLQVPYLITLAMQLAHFVAGMPPVAAPLFRSLDKLDYAFASLLVGRDFAQRRARAGGAGDAFYLPGLRPGEGRGVSGTEKVRIRSLVERTRIAVVEAFKRADFEMLDGMDDGGSDVQMEGDDDVDDDDLDGLVLENEDHEHFLDDDDDEATLDMQIARVYDRTMVELGESLEAPDIGVITESRG